MAKEKEFVKDKVVVRFHASWTKYFAGDQAAFEPHLAQKLVNMRNDNKPLVTVVRNGDLMKRIAVTKGGKIPPKSTPLDGDPEKVPVTKTLAEVVGSPKERKSKKK